MVDVNQDEAKAVENLRIKDSLVFSVRKEENDYQYILEDILSESFYRIGHREYDFIIQLDGKTPLGNALVNVNSVHEDNPLTEEQATEVITWLLKEKLINIPEEMGKISAADPSSLSPFVKIIKKMNIIFFRLPLLNPDSYLDKLLPKLSWVVSKPFMFVWLFVLFSGIYHVFSQWPRFEQASLGVFYPLNWLWLIVGYIVIKTSHEIFHGLVSKHYGGSVNEAGVIFVLFIPIGYVNATSSWHFANKWQRFHTAVAGMFIELLFAGIACWVWAYTDTGPLNNFAYNMIVIASVSTLLFNANPLMRFDGYFALSDVLNIPNLYARGRQYVQYLIRRYILGQQVINPDQAGYKANIVKAYGIASSIWRVFIIIFIMVAAYSLFYGAGIVLASIALLGMVLPPLIRVCKTLMDREGDKSMWLPSALRVLLIATVAGIIFTQLSWSRDIIAPGVIDFEPSGTVKAEISGFVQQVEVRQGDKVKVGQVLAQLVNKELQTDLKVLDKQLARSKSAARIYLNRDQLAQYKIENENIVANEAQLQLKQDQVDSLTIRAPIDGTVVTDQLHKNIGQYVEIGGVLAYIGNYQDKRIYFSVLQKDQYDNQKLTDRPIKVRVNNGGRRNVQVTIHQETPRASKTVNYPQLSITNGGPLSVVPITSGDTDSNSSGSSFEFLEPRAEISATIRTSDAEHVYAGQIGWARLPSIKRPLGEHLFNKLSNWITHLFDRERW